MVDAVRVQRLLRRVADDTTMLETEANANAQRRSDAMWLHGIKYVFITAIEGCVASSPKSAPIPTADTNATDPGADNAVAEYAVIDAGGDICD